MNDEIRKQQDLAQITQFVASNWGVSPGSQSTIDGEPRLQVNDPNPSMFSYRMATLLSAVPFKGRTIRLPYELGWPPQPTQPR